MIDGRLLLVAVAGLIYVLATGFALVYMIEGIYSAIKNRKDK